MRPRLGHVGATAGQRMRTQQVLSPQHETARAQCVAEQRRPSPRGAARRTHAALRFVFLRAERRPAGRPQLARHGRPQARRGAPALADAPHAARLPPVHERLHGRAQGGAARRGESRPLGSLGSPLPHAADTLAVDEGGRARATASTNALWAARTRGRRWPQPSGARLLHIGRRGQPRSAEISRDQLRSCVISRDIRCEIKPRPGQQKPHTIDSETSRDQA